MFSNGFRITCEDIDTASLLSKQYELQKPSILNGYDFFSQIRRSNSARIKRTYLLQQILKEIANPYTTHQDNNKDNNSNIEQWLVELIGEFLGFEKIFILVPNDLDNNFYIQGGYGIPKEQLEHVVFSTDKGICGHVYKSKQPHLANVIMRHGNMECNHYLDINGIRPAKSELAIPIIFNWRVIGILDIQSDKYDSFSVEDVLILNTLANAIALKMENEYKKAVEKEEIAALTIIEEASSSTLYGKSFEQLFIEFSKRLSSQFQPDLITLYRLAPGTAYPLTPPIIFGELHFKEYIQRNYLSRKSVLFHLFSTWKPEFYSKSQENRLFISPLVDKTEKQIEYQRFVIREDIKATVFMPLGTFEDRAGILFLNFRRQIHFDKKRMIELQAISNMYAIQLLLAQQRELRESPLFHDSPDIHTELDLKLLSILSQMEQSLNSEITKKEILMAINDQLREMLDDLLLQLSYRAGKFEEPNSLENRIEQFVSTLKRSVQNNINVETSISPGVSYSGGAINQAIYAIVCEAMLNAVKHGEANKITATVIKSSDSIKIEVNDNGKGFNVKEKYNIFRLKKDNNKKKISGIFSRINAIETLFGAETEITSIKEKGSKIFVKVPLIEEAKNEGD